MCAMKIFQVQSSDPTEIDTRWFPTELKAHAYCRDVYEAIGAPKLHVEELELPSTPEAMCALVNGLLDRIQR